MNSAPCSRVKDLRSTKAMVLAPALRQREQWQVPIMLGGLANSNWMAPQQQLPLIILFALKWNNCILTQYFLHKWLHRSKSIQSRLCRKVLCGISCASDRSRGKEKRKNCCLLCFCCCINHSFSGSFGGLYGVKCLKILSLGRLGALFMRFAAPLHLSCDC